MCSFNEDGEDDKNFFFFTYRNQSQQLAFYSLELQQPSPWFLPQISAWTDLKIEYQATKVLKQSHTHWHVDMLNLNNSNQFKTDFSIQSNEYISFHHVARKWAKPVKTICAFLIFVFWNTSQFPTSYTVRTTGLWGTTTAGTGQCGSCRCSDAIQVLNELDEASKAYPNSFIMIIGFDNVRQVQCSSFDQLILKASLIIDHCNLLTWFVWSVGCLVLFYEVFGVFFLFFFFFWDLQFGWKWIVWV